MPPREFEALRSEPTIVKDAAEHGLGLEGSGATCTPPLPLVPPTPGVELAQTPVDEAGRHGLERHGQPIERGHIDLGLPATRRFDDSLRYPCGQYAPRDPGPRRPLDLLEGLFRAAHYLNSRWQGCPALPTT